MVERGQIDWGRKYANSDAELRSRGPNFYGFLGYRLLDDDFPYLFGQSGQTVVATLNPHSYVVAKSDAAFRAALQDADILLPDGIGIPIASFILDGKTIRRHTGPDIGHLLLRQAEQRSGRCFFLGSSESLLALIHTNIGAVHPRIVVGSFSPPFAEVFSDKQVEEMILRVNAFAPDVLFLGLTAPKQEKLANLIRKGVKAPIIISVGALFDAIAGTRPTAPRIFSKLGLAWAYRLAREPRRLWKRTFISAPLFLADVIAAKFHP